MASPSFSAAADHIEPPPELVPLRAFLAAYARQLFDPTSARQEGLPSPHGLLFGMWALDSLDLWGRRGRLDASLTLIAAPLPERQSSAYDMEELGQHSCLRRRGGEVFYDVHVSAKPPLLRILPIRSQGRPLIYEGAARPLRGRSNHAAIRAAYQQLSAVEQCLQGTALHQAIRRVFSPRYRNTDPNPPGLSPDTIDRALSGIKDGC